MTEKEDQLCDFHQMPRQRLSQSPTQHCEVGTGRPGGQVDQAAPGQRTI